MLGLKKTFEVRWPTILMAIVLAVVAVLVYFTQPKANPFKPMELACVDT